MSRPPQLSFSEEEKKSNDDFVSSVALHRRNTMEHSFTAPQNCLMVSSQAETLLLSSAGDVLTARCRLCPYPSGSAGSSYRWQDDIAALCCDANDCDDLSTQVQSDNNLCAPWAQRQESHDGIMKSGSSSSNRHSKHKGGLLGGAPVVADVANSFHNPPPTLQHDHHAANSGTVEQHNLPSMKLVPESESAWRSHAPTSLRTQPLDTDCTPGFEAESILPIRSFDHSLYTLTPKRPDNRSHVKIAAEKENIPRFVHGIPTFYFDFSNVKVKTISANPLGSHVLLISNAGLLYSYGLNHCGQLGIGFQSDIRGAHRGYVMTPTIVTPLVENGGKAIACSAGLSHSLVVVETQERRLVKKSHSFEGLLNNQDEDMQSTEVVHHQVYGFGRNDYMKIGLVNPKVSSHHRPTPAGGKTTRNTDEMECVVVPRRVALHASFNQSNTSDQGKLGVFAIAASKQHSAALVRTQNGEVETYMWGNSTHGALGLPAHPSPKQKQQHRHQHIVPVPTFVASLSHAPSNLEVAPQSLLTEGEYPVTLALSKTCSFVVTSQGRCFSFGSSDEGMLGLGRDVKETHHPTDVILPPEAHDEHIVSVSAGACHVIATCSSGAAYAWGVGRYAGLVEAVTSVPDQRPSSKGKPMATSSPKPQHHFEWSPKRVIMPYEHLHAPCHRSSGAPQSAPVVQACAGFDCSLFLSHSGCVYSTGKKSGRLGLGELSDAVVGVPRPLFGGLHLWKRDDDRSHGSSIVEPLPRLVPPKMPSRKIFMRGLTLA